jgi:hypothetical protein
VAPLLQQPFFQVTLPLTVVMIVASFTAVWSTNRRVDGLSHGLDDTNRRLDRLETAVDRVNETLLRIEHRLTVLEERYSPFASR